MWSNSQPTIIILFVLLGNSDGFVPPSTSTSNYVDVKCSSRNKVCLDAKVENSPYFSKEVPYGETSRKYRRTVYNADLWLQHRAPDRFFGNMISDFFTSGIVRQLLGEVLVVTSIAFLVCFWNVFFIDGYTGLDGTHFEPLVSSANELRLVLPSVPFNLSTSALGLLLGKFCSLRNE